MRDGELHAFVGYFDVFFDGGVPVHFSTGPGATPTHWKQTVFTLSKKVAIRKGDLISGTFRCTRCRDNCRELEVLIAYWIDGADELAPVTIRANILRAVMNNGIIAYSRTTLNPAKTS